MTSNTYRPPGSQTAHGGHHLVDGLMRCDACWGVCLPQYRCRCCLTTEIDMLRAQVRAVRELHQPTPGINGTHWCAAGCCNTVDGDPTEWPCETIRVLDGDA